MASDCDFLFNRHPIAIYKRPLVYKVNIYGVPEATEDDRIRRRYADSTYQYEPRGRLLRKAPSTGEVWAILKPLTEVTQVQELTQAKYTFGRNEGRNELDGGSLFFRPTQTLF